MLESLRMYAYLHLFVANATILDPGHFWPSSTARKPLYKRACTDSLQRFSSFKVPDGVARTLSEEPEYDVHRLNIRRCSGWQQASV